MFGYEYPRELPMGRVCLEVSLNPFGLDLSDEGIDRTCRELFDGWKELIRHASSVAVLMWTSDGSEILEYDGNPDSTFDWCKYIGRANNITPLPEWDPEGRCVHNRPRIYMDNPPEMRYGDLRRILAALRRAGREVLGREIEIGETFDPGPEFAQSDFKFFRHPEMNRSEQMGSMWIHCAGALHADSRPYAAYPEGIPEGTPFGTFLGKQFMALKRDLGFDFIWLSNGFGFALDAWYWKGEGFDGRQFDPSVAGRVREGIEAFWNDFTAQTGDTRIETRGSNFSAAMDISVHGCPVDAIYKYPIIAPPNSPWAAIDSRFGLELAGYMSRIARLPKEGYLFRFYTHDPWFMNSPWFDRYDRMPYDLYLPLSVARMDENGRSTPPMGVNLLSADDSYGRLPRRCPVEVTPHLLEAYSLFPDEPGCVVWLYPFDSYVRLGLREGRPGDLFMDDWLIENAIDEGLPLNTVVADGVFLASDPARYAGRILVTPVPHADTPAEEALLKALKAGLSVVTYGNTAWASERVRRLLGVALAEPIEGELTIDTQLVQDTARDLPLPSRLVHASAFSGGGISEVAAGDESVELLASVSDGTSARAYATLNRCAEGGRIAWMRGSFPHDAESTGPLPRQLDRRTYFPVSSLLRGLIARMGLTVRFHAEERAASLPIVQFSMNDNAYVISSYSKDTTVRSEFAFPEGAPLIDGSECVYEQGAATYALPKWQHRRCRLLVRQQERGVLGVMRRATDFPEADELFLVSGLKDATLIIRPPMGAEVFVTNEENDRYTGRSSCALVYSEDRRTVRAEHLSGSYYVAWRSDHNPGCMIDERQYDLKVVPGSRQ